MMLKRFVVSITLVCTVLYLGKCTSKYLMSRHEIQRHPEYPIFKVITEEGEVFEFDPSAALVDSVITGRLKDGSSVEIPLTRVAQVYAGKPDMLMSATACCLVGGATVVLMFVLAFAGLADFDLSE